MRHWIIPANSTKYDYFSAFNDKGFIDWTKKSKYEEGDTVYLYCTRPQQKIMYKAIIDKIFISSNIEVDDRKYWLNKSEFDKNQNMKKEFIRLKLLKYVDNENLSLENLKDNGLKTAPQGPLRVASELLEYIEKYI
jgi:HNH endonuclease domain protein